MIFGACTSFWTSSSKIAAALLLWNGALLLEESAMAEESGRALISLGKLVQTVVPVSRQSALLGQSGIASCWELAARRSRGLGGDTSDWDQCVSSQADSVGAKATLAGAWEQAPQRLAVVLTADNRWINAVLTGRLALSVNIGDEEGQPASLARPEYRLVRSSPARDSGSITVAALGDAKFAPRSKKSSAVVEAMDAEAKIVPVWQANKSTEKAPSENLTWRQQVQHVFGLSQDPFTRFDVRIERGAGVDEFDTDFRLCVDEGAGLLSWDLTPALAGLPGNTQWQLRLPFAHHTMRVSGLGAGIIENLGYEYSSSGNVSGFVAVNPGAMDPANNAGQLLNLGISMFF